MQTISYQILVEMEAYVSGSNILKKDIGNSYLLKYLYIFWKVFAHPLDLLKVGFDNGAIKDFGKFFMRAFKILCQVNLKIKHVI